MRILGFVPVTIVFLASAGCSPVNRDLNTAAFRAQAEEQGKKRTVDAEAKMRVLSEALRVAGAEYRLGAGDVVEINTFGLLQPRENAVFKMRVNRRGTLRLPLVGDVEVGGRTVEEIQADLEGRIRRDLMPDPIVSVYISEYASRRVAVIGAVEKGGIYSLQKEGVSLVEALALAGGTSEKAGFEAFVVLNSQATRAPTAVIRPSAQGEPTVSLEGGGPEIRKIDLFELLKQGHMELNLNLSDGDVVFVPEAERVYVTGWVKKPGEVPLKTPLKTMDAVAAAGGVDEKYATPSMTFVRRKTPEGDQIISVDLTAVVSGREADIALLPGDVVEVPQSTFSFLTWELLDLAKSMIGINAYDLNR